MTFLPEGLPVLIAVFWKSGAELSAALFLNVLLRKKSADVRRLVLSTTLSVLFIAAAAMPVMPSWHACGFPAAPAIGTSAEISLPVGSGARPAVVSPANLSGRKYAIPQSG